MRRWWAGDPASDGPSLPGSFRSVEDRTLL